MNAKLKYFEVTTSSIVAAKNKSDAYAIARGRRGVSGKVMKSEQWADRITSTEAHRLSETHSVDA
jgi:hypothetical protein